MPDALCHDWGVLAPSFCLFCRCSSERDSFVLYDIFAKNCFKYVSCEFDRFERHLSYFQAAWCSCRLFLQMKCFAV